MIHIETKSIRMQKKEHSLRKVIHIIQLLIQILQTVSMKDLRKEMKSFRKKMMRSVWLRKMILSLETKKVKKVSRKRKASTFLKILRT